LFSVTGLLLGIKKQPGLLAPPQKGSSPDLAAWLPVDFYTKKQINTWLILFLKICR
jgi:hypothetical protein